MIRSTLAGLCKTLRALVYRREGARWFYCRQANPSLFWRNIMSLDSYVTLGRSGLRVSPFCLGTMTFGEDWGWGSSPADSELILAEYLDGGGNFIDTANIYTKG